MGGLDDRPRFSRFLQNPTTAASCRTGPAKIRRGGQFELEDTFETESVFAELELGY